LRQAIRQSLRTFYKPFTPLLCARCYSENATNRRAGFARLKSQRLVVRKGETQMPDLIFILLALAFFGFAFWYVRFCDRV